MFPVSYFLLEKKKEYKTYTFFKEAFFFFFNLLETEHLPLSKAIQLWVFFCWFLFVIFFFLQVSIYAGITNFGGYVFL